MTPVPRDDLFQVLRSVEPPPGAKARGLARLSLELEPARRRRRVFVPVLVLLGVLVAGTSLAAVGVRAWRASQAREERAEPVSQGAAQTGGVRVAEGAVTPAVPMRSRTEIPAADRAAPSETEPLLHAEGSTARHRAGGLAPKSHRERGDDQAEATPAPRGTDAVAQKPGADADSLSEQVAAYRKIAGMTNREAALGEWRGMLLRWPRTTLRHEIELSIVDALGRLGRRDEARGAASTFLKHFPSSPRAVDMKKLLAGDASRQ
jgi:hypothetical protein